MKKFNSFAKNEKGMTLLEIMIVLVILAGLTGVLVTVVQGRLKKANIRQTKIAISELGKSLDLYYTDCHNYPTSEQGLKALLEAPESCPDWGPDPYVKKVPKDGVKIISNGDLHKKLELTGFLLTKGAREKVEKSGSKIVE